MDAVGLLARARTALAASFGRRLRGVVLYGSHAPRQAGPDSDVDLLVLLDGPMDDRADSWTCIRCLYPLVLGVLVVFFSSLAA